MISSKNRVFLWMGVAIALNWLLIVVLNPTSSGGGLIENICVGLMFGTLFSHTTVAAAWTALGPGPLAWRAPLSLLWVALFPVAIEVNMSQQGGLFLFLALLLGQWLLLQFPLWGLAIGQGVQLRHSDANDVSNPSKRQFALRQLIIVTAGIGVLLGVARVIIPHAVDQIDIQKGNLLDFIFLAVAAVALTLPLLLASLLPRNSILAVLLALTLIGLATVWEYQLFTLTVGPIPGAGFRVFIAINAGTAILMLALLTIVRVNGYSLATSAAKI